MKKIKRWNSGFIRHAFRRSRSAVERLEDRILLSAEPLVQFNRMDVEQPLSVENMEYSAQKKAADPLAMETISSIASLIDLTKPQTQQNAKFNWTGSTSSLLKLNSQLSAVVLDLGDGDTQAMLSNEGNGMLRLSRLGGDAMYDIVFAKPSSILGVRGEGGIDRLVLDNVDLGSTSLSVDVEQIELPSTSAVTSQSNILLMARNSFSGDLGPAMTGSDDLNLASSVDVAGSLQVAGNVVMAAEVSVELQQEVALTGFYTLNGNTTARVRVSDGAQITAHSLAMTATTESRWAMAANDGLIGGRLALDLAQTTEAVVEGGVTLSLSPQSNEDGSVGTGLLIEAADWTDAAVTLDMADGEINGLAKNTEAGQALEGFELGWTQIDLKRNTVASLGSTAQGSGLVTVSGQGESSAGLVQISAASFDGQGNEDGENAGVQGSVMSSLVGLHISNIEHNVQAFTANASLDVGALNLSALNDTTQVANGKIALNRGKGETEAWMDGVDLVSAGAVSLIAQDLATYTAKSEGFSADIPKLDTLKVGIASTSNTVDRKVSAYVLSSNVSASESVLLANNSVSLIVTLESMAVAGTESLDAAPEATSSDSTSGGSEGGSFQMSFGGTFAWNQLTGATQAFVQDSALEISDGGLMVQALNSAELSAQSKAGTAVNNSSGAAAGASLAFNAIGWDMGNIAAAGINSVLGTDLGTTAMPLLTQSFLLRSDVNTTGELSVLAQDTMTVDAQITNSADVVAGEAGTGVSVGAAMILASNRVRSDTRAFVDGKKRLESAAQATLTVGGGLTVSATDDASITADVSMSANVASGSGGAISAGGVFSRNDVRSQVLAEGSAVTLTVEGDAAFLANATALIEATLSGEVVAEAAPADAAAADTTSGSGADAAAGEGGAGGTSVAANGLIATNMILIEANAALRDSFASVGGSLGVESEDSASITAENTASTSSSGVAAGVVLAFNTVGWQAQNIFSAAIDTLIGTDGLGQAQPATSDAEISNTVLEVGEDLSLTAVSVPEINASIENTVNSTGGAAVGLVLASNLVSANANTLLTPKSTTGTAQTPDIVFNIGGNVLAKSSDTASIVARVGAAVGSEGAAAMGAQLVRNDVRSTVLTLVDSAFLDAGGDITLLSRGSASIKALLTDQKLPPLDGSEETPDPAAEGPADVAAAEEPAADAASASMALKGLIATNLVLSDVRVTVLDSDLHAGGDLSMLARNAANIDAENSAKADASGAAVGVTLAFNTIGWKAQNVLFNALDTLLGTSIGDEQPAQILATVTNSNLVADGNLSVDAEAQEQINATIANEASSSGASVAAGMVLASNLLSARARASVTPSLTTPRRVTLSAGGSLQVTASDEAGITADVSMIASSGGAAAVGGLVVRNDVRSQVLSEVENVDGAATEDFLVLALESATIEATLAGETKSLATAADPAADAAAAETAATDSTSTADAATGGTGTDTTAAGGSPLALNGLIATNLVLSEASAKVSHSDLTVDGNLSVQADNIATILANNSASLESDGSAVGVTLAFNTIGWKPQNLFANAIDTLLGTDALGSEQPAAVSAMVLDTAMTVGGDLSVNAGGLGEDPEGPVGALITATISNETTANAANASASFVLASNKVSTTSQAWVGPLLPAAVAIDGAYATPMALLVGGNIEVTATDAGTIEAEVTMAATSGGGTAVGGVVVMNDLRGDVLSSVDRVHIVAAGDVTIASSEASSLSSILSGSTESPAEEPAAEAGMDVAGGVGAAGGAAKPMAVNALIANNLVLGSSRALLTKSQVEAEGSLTLQADNVADITAENTATMSSGGSAVGATLAFNTMGWESQNVLFKAVDALVGSDIGTEDPLVALAKAETVELALGGDLNVLSNMQATLTATTSNEASSESAGAAASMVLASNMVSTDAQAFILQPDDSETYALNVGGAVTVQTDDAPSIVANTVVSATSSGEAADEEGDGDYLQVDYHSGDGETELSFGDQVMVDAGHEAGGTEGRIYRYMGAGETLDLSAENYDRTGLWYELLPPTGFVGDVLAFLESPMPSKEKEIILTTIPMGGMQNDVGFKIGGGWGDLSVGDFLKGVNGDKTGGLTATEQGLTLDTGSILGRAGPELNLELIFPNPDLPNYTYEKVLGTIAHGGEQYDWGIRAAVGWPDAKLFDLINLPALIEGRFEPLLPEFTASVFFGDLEIDSLQCLPPQFVIHPPKVLVTVLGKPVVLSYSSDIVIDTPEWLQDFVDPELDPFVIDVPTMDLDALMKVKGVDDRPDTYWDDALEIDVSNPTLPYFEKEFIFTTVEMGGQDWDVGLKVGAGWQDTTLLDMLTGEPKEGGISALETGIKIQAPATEILGYNVQGPELNLELILPNPELPYYEYRYALGQVALIDPAVIDPVVTDPEASTTPEAATSDSTASSTLVDWGLELSLGWEDTTLLDLVDVEAWLEGDFSIQLPTLDLNVYVDLADDADFSALTPFLPSEFEVSLPSFKLTLLGTEMALGFGTSFTFKTPDKYAALIDSTLPTGTASLPGLDLDVALDALLNGTEVTLDEMKFVPTGQELLVDVTDMDAIEAALLDVIQIIPGNYAFSEPKIQGLVFGIPIEFDVPIDNFSNALLDLSLTEFSLEDVLPESVYRLISPFVDTEADVVNFALPTVDLGTVGPAIGDLPYIEKSFSMDLGTTEAPAEFGIKVSAGWKDTTLVDMLTGDPKEAGIVPLDAGVRFQAPGTAITIPMLDIGPYTLQGPALDIELILPEVDLPYFEYQYALGTLPLVPVESAATTATASAPTEVAFGLELAVGWKDMQLMDLVDTEAWLAGDFSIELPELDIRLYVDLPEGDALGEVKPFLPKYFDIATPSFKATILGHELAIGFGQTLRYATPDTYADYIDASLPVGHAQLPGLDLDAAIQALADGTPFVPKAYVPGQNAIDVDLTDLDSVTAAFRTLIQVIPENYKINDPSFSGKLFGVQIDADIPLSILAPSLVEFSLSDILPQSVYKLMEPFIKPSTDPEDVVVITLPELQLPDVGPSVPFVDQFLEMLKTMPTEVRLYNPTVSASLLGLKVDELLPLTDVAQTLADELGLTIFTVVDNPDDPAESYLQFSLLNMVEKLPQTMQDLLGYFVDSDLDTSDRPPMELRVPELAFGDLTPAGLDQYTP